MVKWGKEFLGGVLKTKLCWVKRKAVNVWCRASDADQLEELRVQNTGNKPPNRIPKGVCINIWDQSPKLQRSGVEKGGS